MDIWFALYDFLLIIYMKIYGVFHWKRPKFLRKQTQRDCSMAWWWHQCVRTWSTNMLFKNTTESSTFLSFSSPVLFFLDKKSIVYRNVCNTKDKETFDFKIVLAIGSIEKYLHWMNYFLFSALYFQKTALLSANQNREFFHVYY